jgi:hypothetical protein
MGSLMQRLVCVCSNIQRSIRVPALSLALCVCVWAERGFLHGCRRRSEFLSGVQ